MAKKAARPLIGFVGQGFVGKNYADDFDARGYTTIRYALEAPYHLNKGKLAEAHVVFVCVPTPTTPKGFDLSIVEDALGLLRERQIAVIKSTLLPGSTVRLQKAFPHITILMSPEFLSVSTARQDAASPFSNIIGVPERTARHMRAAKLVHGVLPQAQFAHTCHSHEAEIIKYAHNISGYTQILTFNAMYDLAQKVGADWSSIQPALKADPMISSRYADPVHKSGRGAGGACFIKDMAAFAKLYEEVVGRPEGIEFLKAAQRKNIALMLETKKDLDLLEGVYGKKVHKRKPSKTKKRRARKK